MKSEFNVNFSTRVLILDDTTGDILLDKSNAIHSQNMARVIARGLADETNSFIYRIAFGNGGSFVDAGGNIVLNTPNDGSGGEGPDSRLYRETYSEVVKPNLYNESVNNQKLITSVNDNPLLGRDIGSFGPDGIRLGGGENYDPSLPNNISSEEVGRKSNVIVEALLSVDEPNSQLPANIIDVDSSELFNFDELGFYSSGGPATNTPGYQRIDVLNKNSDDIIEGIEGNVYNLSVTVDGNIINETITVPATGSGPANEITYGDLCKGINGGDWLNGGSESDLATNVEVSITDRSEQDYGVISGKNTFGFLVFESKTVGSTSSVNLNCTTNTDDLLNVWGCASIDPRVDGLDRAGIDDRERLLTHITFPPILKKRNRALRIVYTLTVSVAQVDGTIVETRLL